MMNKYIILENICQRCLNFLLFFRRLNFVSLTLNSDFTFGCSEGAWSHATVLGGVTDAVGGVVDCAADRYLVVSGFLVCSSSTVIAHAQDTHDWSRLLASLRLVSGSCTFGAGHCCHCRTDRFPHVLHPFKHKPIIIMQHLLNLIWINLQIKLFLL